MYARPRLLMFDEKSDKKLTKLDSPFHPHLPHDMLKKIMTTVSDGDYSSKRTTQVMSTLSLVCKNYHNFFANELFIRKMTYQITQAEKTLELLTAVLQGNLITVLEYAKNSPEHFFMKIDSMVDCAMDLDRNSRILIAWSPYQAMFGRCDIDMLWDKKKQKPSEIIDYLDKYLDTLPNGHKLAYDQEQEKFPNGFQYSETTFDLTTLVHAITHDENLIQGDKINDNTRDAIQEFRRYFKQGVITTGFHFNLNELVNVYAVYENNCNSNFNNSENPWNKNQEIFYSKYVIGFIQRLLPIHIIKILCLGILNSNDASKRDCIAKKIGTNKKISILPLDRDRNYRLGEHFLIDNGYATEKQFISNNIHKGLWPSIFFDDIAREHIVILHRVSHKDHAPLQVKECRIL